MNAVGTRKNAEGSKKEIFKVSDFGSVRCKVVVRF